MAAGISIAQLNKILDQTPIDQAILIEGPHGIGKSEVVKQNMEKRGYRMITFFLGQLSDVGDLIGLPSRRKIKIPAKFVNGGSEANGVFDLQYETDGEGNVLQTITEFAPPKWWPWNPDEKICLFLDEYNRGGKEVHNAMLEMVLNHTLNGIPLPKNTRIIAAQNPSEDGIYSVNDLDPANLSRFNAWKFCPTVEEWADFALDHGINKHVIGFIMKNNTYLMPPDKDSHKENQIGPCPRSWEKVSDILNQFPNCLDDKSLLRIQLSGVVGDTCAAAFDKYLQTAKDDLSARGILNFLHKKDKKKEIVEKIESLSPQYVVSINREICNYFDEQHRAGNLLIDGKCTTHSMNWVKNLSAYLKILKGELQGNFFSLLSQDYKDGKEYAEVISDIDPTLAVEQASILAGEKHGTTYEENFEDDDEKEEWQD